MAESAKQFTINLYGNESANQNQWFAEKVTKNTIWSKIGIQAPAGTKFKINGNTFYMGPNEIFELNGLDIYSFQFARQNEYVYDEKATEQAKEQYQIYIEACNWWGDTYVVKNNNENDQLIQAKNWATGNLEKPITIYYNLNKEEGVYQFSTTRGTPTWYDSNNFEFKGVDGIPAKASAAINGVYVPSGEIVLKEIIVDYIEERAGE